MTDTPTPPMTPEQRAVLVAELRLPWFTNGCEWYQVRAANSLEADGVTIATLTAERDEAKDCEKIARALMQRAFDVNRKVIAERDAAQAEIARLTAALATARDTLFGIGVYASDTLSGPSSPDPETYEEWLLDGIREILSRANDATQKGDAT